MAAGTVCAAVVEVSVKAKAKPFQAKMKTRITVVARPEARLVRQALNHLAGPAHRAQQQERQQLPLVVVVGGGVEEVIAHRPVNIPDRKRGVPRANPNLAPRPAGQSPSG